MAQPTPLLQVLDEAPLTRRFYVLAAAVMVGAVLDLFDFFLIAFVVPDLADEWDLTFGQAAAMLLAAGIGAIGGSILWGRLGGRHGRRRPLMWGILTFSLATGALALAPEGGWWYIALLRLVVGAGVAGVAVIAVPLALEFTPTRLRTQVVGFVTTAMVPIGIMVAAVVAAVLPWRASFAIGLLPIVMVPFIAWYVPESPRWLADKGRLREARRVVAWLTERPEDELALEAPPPQPSGDSYAALWRYRRSVLVTVLAWLGASIAVSGLVLWGPTFLERILDISADEAALLFLLVALGSFAGRLFFSFVPQRLGRRTSGLLMGCGAVPALVLAAWSGDTEVFGIPLFLVALIPAAFFVDGGFANLAPYTPEVFPTSLRTHGMGLAWAVSGLGRIIGPLVIALVAGTGDLVDPEATLDALAPSFLFLAGSALLVVLGFLLVRIEPHGTDLETLSAELTEESVHPAGGPAALEHT